MWGGFGSFTMRRFSRCVVGVSVCDGIGTGNRGLLAGSSSGYLWCSVLQSPLYASSRYYPQPGPWGLDPAAVNCRVVV